MNNADGILKNNSFKYLDIFTCVLANKNIFNKKSNELFNNIIKPAWIKNGRKKLRLNYTKENNLVIEKHHGLLPNDESCYNIIAVSLIDGSNLEKQAFLWYISTELKPLTRYFRVGDLNGWVFMSGIGNDTEILERNYYGIDAKQTVFFESWRDIALKGLYHNTQSYCDYVAESLKIGEIYDLVGCGYNDYIAERKQKDLSLPNLIKNKMDYAMWKRSIDNMRITGKNFKQVIYSGNNPLKNNKAGVFQLQIWEHLLTKKQLKGRRYFIDAYMKFEFCNGDNGDYKGGVSKNALITRFTEYNSNNSAWMWNRERNEFLAMINHSELNDYKPGELMDIKLWMERNFNLNSDVYDLDINVIINKINSHLI